MYSRTLGLVCLLALALTATNSGAGDNVRHVELSVAGSAQAFVNDGYTDLALNMPVRVGTFVTKDALLEVEGIFTVIAPEGYNHKSAITVSLNGSYNFPASDKILPFLLFGLGYSNGAPLGNVIAGSLCNQRDFRVLNAGAGAKFLFTPKAALRVEYRYQNFLEVDIIDIGFGRHDENINFGVHSMFFGVSLFL